MTEEEAELYYNFFKNLSVPEGSRVFFDGKECLPMEDEFISSERNLFSYETMKRAVELYEATEMTKEELEDYYRGTTLWSWCVNTALAENNNVID